jgi:hypothetical protein
MLFLFSVTAAPFARAETLYLETYQGEPGYPTNPEVDVLGLGGMGAGSNGASGVPPPLPVLTGDRVTVQLTTPGVVPPTEETSSTYVDARSVLAAHLPFAVTGRFQNLRVSPEQGSMPIAAMLLYSSTTGYAVSASLYVYSNGTSLFPSLNIAELTPGEAPKIQTQFLNGVPVTAGEFSITLVIDPTTNSANTRFDVAGVTYELLPLALNPAAFEIHQPDVLTQTFGIDNRLGPGHSGSVDFREFRITTPRVRATIDVKPGDPKNVISRTSSAATPVAVFSAGDFDATAIVPATLTLGGAPVVQSRRGGLLCGSIDLNRDRRPDLLCLVATARIDAPLGASIVTLNAVTADGTPVIGEDRIRLVR